MNVYLFHSHVHARRVEGATGRSRLFQDRTYIELDLQVFLEGLLCEYVKYCRGYSATTLDDLYEYTKHWATNFIAMRSTRP